MAGMDDAMKSPLRRNYCVVGWLVGWLVSELAGWLAGWLVGWLQRLVGWLAGWLAGWLVRGCGCGRGGGGCCCCFCFFSFFLLLLLGGGAGAGVLVVVLVLVFVFFACFVRNCSSQTRPVAPAGLAWLADLLQSSSLSTCSLAGLPACLLSWFSSPCLLADFHVFLLGCRLASLLALLITTAISFLSISLAQSRDHSLVLICLHTFQHFLFIHLIDFL